MSFIKSAIGAMIGFSIGGPIGALIGGVIGSKLGSSRSQYDTRSKFTLNEQNQAAFFTALFACLAKLAKADGYVSKEEIEKVDSYIENRFKFEKQQRQFAIQIFNKAKDDTVTYEEYASQLSGLLGKNKNALVVFYELLFELAFSDGVLDDNEEILLRKTTHIFGLDPGLFEDLKSRFLNTTSSPYKTLGVDENMTLSEIKKVYQKKRREFHPDTLTSKGLPDELMERAKEKFVEIQNAYEEIQRKKVN